MPESWVIVTMLALVAAAEIGLIFAIRSSTKEIRGMRQDLPKMAATLAALAMLSKAAEIYSRKGEGSAG